MKISRQELRVIARNFLMLLTEEGLDSYASLETKLNEKIAIMEGHQDFVIASLRPSNLRTSAFTISYVGPGTGVPIEFKQNLVLDYSQVILKCEELLPGYELFATDFFNNQVQNKMIHTSDFDRIKPELNALQR